MTDALPTARTAPRNGYIRVLVFCNSCRHQADADLQAIVESGRGDVPLTELRFRCSQCGTVRTDFVVTSRVAAFIAPATIGNLHAGWHVVTTIAWVALVWDYISAHGRCSGGCDDMGSGGDVAHLAGGRGARPGRWRDLAVAPYPMSDDHERIWAVCECGYQLEREIGWLRARADRNDFICYKCQASTNYTAEQVDKVAAAQRAGHYARLRIN
jgi:hypothetical protein